MIAVIVPAHNEEALIRRCLVSIMAAAQCSALLGEEVRTYVALDRCSDDTAVIVDEMSAIAVHGSHGNVGNARASAAEAALFAEPRWLAFTDADSRVPVDWLFAQVNSGGDAFCGVVDVDDWEDYGAPVIAAFRRNASRFDGHPHVHGANFGVSPHWYRRAGGFSSLPAHEDVALVDALVTAGASIARRAQPVVLTSARRIARASAGFSDHLHHLETLTRCAIDC